MYPKDLFLLTEHVTQSEAQALELPGRSRVEFDPMIKSPNYSNYISAPAPELSIHSRDNEKPTKNDSFWTCKSILRFSWDRKAGTDARGLMLHGSWSLRRQSALLLYIRHYNKSNMLWCLSWIFRLCEIHSKLCYLR